MNPPIKNDQELKTALERLDALWSVEPSDPAWNERESLSERISAYEDAHHEIPPPDPVDAIRFRMEQQGLRQKDLVPFIGPESRVSEILNRKRKLTKRMIASLHEGLGIPLSSLHGLPPAPTRRWAGATVTCIGGVKRTETQGAPSTAATSTYGQNCRNQAA